MITMNQPLHEHATPAPSGFNARRGQTRGAATSHRAPARPLFRRSEVQLLSPSGRVTNDRLVACRHPKQRYTPRPPAASPSIPQLLPKFPPVNTYLTCATHPRPMSAIAMPLRSRFRRCVEVKAALCRPMRQSSDSCKQP